MKVLLVLVLTLITLTGCELFADKPNNAAAFTSDQIVALAIQVDRAQEEGLVSEEKGDYYIELLIQANALLGGTLDTFNYLEECKTSETKYQCIDNIMVKVQEFLE